MSQFKLKSQLLGAPNTTRGVPGGVSAAAHFVAYGCQNSAIVRSTTDLSYVAMCQRHTSPVTCVRLSPGGVLVASGDREGSVLIWGNRADAPERLAFKPLSGPVRDIAWSADGERIAVSGDGKSGFAGAFAVSGGNTIGNLTVHTQQVLSCDFRPARPFRIATGSADSRVGFFEGPPFKFVHTVDGFKGTVNNVRFSPDGALIAAVSGAAEIEILDGLTGAKQRSIKTDHSGTIYGVAWSTDGLRIAACSSDKTVSLWSAADGSQIAKSAAFGTSIGFMQLGLAATEASIITTGLNGDVTFLAADSLQVKQVWRGHSRPVVALSCMQGGGILSVGSDNKILRSTGAVADSPLAIPGNEVDIFGAVHSGNDLWTVTGSDIFRCDLAKGSVAKVCSHAGGCVGAALLASGHLAVLQKSLCVVYSATGSKVHEEKLPRFDAASIAAHGDLVIIGGEKEARVFTAANGVLSAKLAFKEGHEHGGTVSALAFNHNGTLVASGDSNRQLLIWNPRDGSVVRDNMCFHTARIAALSFSPSSNVLASAGVDGTVVAWAVEGSKRSVQDFAHRNGVGALCFVDENTIATSGADGAVKTWSYEF